MKRITQKYLLQWLRDEFKRLEIDLEVQSIHKTYFRRHDYEAGAAHFIYVVGPKGKGHILTFSIFIFYPLSYLQRELNNGYELYFKPRPHGYLMDSEVDIRRKA